ncbi:hypothetical protein Nmel_003926 [Mimus melanotis]
MAVPRTPREQTRPRQQERGAVQTHLPWTESSGRGRGCHQSPFASSPRPPPPRPLREGGCRRDRARTPLPPGSRHPRPAEPGNGDRNLPGKTRSWAAESPNLAPSRVPAVPWGPSPARRALLDSAGQAPGPVLGPAPVPGPSRCPRGWREGAAPQRPRGPPCRDTSHVPAPSPPPVPATGAAPHTGSRRSAGL